MARARITLMETGPVSFSGNGYDLKRGEVRIVTSESDIAYFQAQVGISVEMMEDPKPAPKAAVKPARAPAPEPEADDEEETEPEDGPATGAITAAELSKMTKAALLQHNEEAGVGAEVDASMSKGDIIKAILAARPEDETDDEG